MGLAPAVVDRQLAVGPIALTGQAPGYVPYQLPQAQRGVAEGEEFFWVLIYWSLAPLHDHVIEVGSEDRQ